MKNLKNGVKIITTKKELANELKKLANELKEKEDVISSKTKSMALPAKNLKHYAGEKVEIKPIKIKVKKIYDRGKKVKIDYKLPIVKTSTHSLSQIYDIEIQKDYFSQNELIDVDAMEKQINSDIRAFVFVLAIVLAMITFLII